MAESLLRIIEGTVARPRIIEMNGCKYYIVPLAADLSGVPRGTMDRWAKNGFVQVDDQKFKGIPLKVYRDTLCGHHYVSERVIEFLREDRLVPV